MSTRNQNWYNLQATRRYPLDDNSTGDDDNGGTLRDDIVVDCNIRFPETYGAYLYVQGITVSAGLVSVLIGATTELNAPGVTVAAVSLVKPVNSYVNYAITPLVAGISGWIVFGPGIDSDFVGRYTHPRQSLIAPRCARAFRALPIPSIGKLGLSTALTGLVTFDASSPVTVTYRENAGDVVDGNSRAVVATAKNALVFELDQTLTTVDYNPLQLFVGPCGQRPESGTCPRTPIESVNGAVPDCDGNIEIEFVGFGSTCGPQKIIGCDPLKPDQCCGIDLWSCASLAEACDAGLPDPKREFKDICCTPEPGKIVDEYCWADPTPDIDVVIDDPIEFNYTCATFPVCVDFSGCFQPDRFITVSGNFLNTQTPAPPLCGESGSAETNHNVYAAAGNAINIAAFKNCTDAWALNRTVSAQLSVSNNGVDRNGGIVLNYRQEAGTTTIRTTYIAIMLDINRSRLRVLRYTGSSFIEEHFVTIRARTNVWYRISAAPIANNDGTVTLEYSATRVDGSGTTASGSVTLSNYGPPTGQAGIFSRQAYTYFNKFEIQ